MDSTDIIKIEMIYTIKTYKNGAHMAPTKFSFKVEQSPNLEEELEWLLRKYNVGKARIRCVICPRIGSSRTTSVYYVDVDEPTKYGAELLDWLRRGKEYEKQRREQEQNGGPPFPDCLHGPVWATEAIDGFVLRRWWLKITRTPQVREKASNASFR